MDARNAIWFLLENLLGHWECPSLVLIELDLSFSEVAVPMYSNSSV